MTGRCFWPKLGNAGLASLLALTLRTQDRTLGSLNLVRDAAHAFDAEDRRIGAIFAAHAGVALSNAQTLEHARVRVDQLLEGYADREVIGQAKGILMEREGLSKDEAFQVLRRTSSECTRSCVKSLEMSSIPPRKGNGPRDGPLRERGAGRRFPLSELDSESSAQLSDQRPHDLQAEGAIPVAHQAGMPTPSSLTMTWT